MVPGEVCVSWADRTREMRNSHNILPGNQNERGHFTNLIARGNIKFSRSYRAMVTCGQIAGSGEDGNEYLGSVHGQEIS